jgi:hypothetical protein
MSIEPSVKPTPVKFRLIELNPRDHCFLSQTDNRDGAFSAALRCFHFIQGTLFADGDFTFPGK